MDIEDFHGIFGALKPKAPPVALPAAQTKITITSSKMIAVSDLPILAQCSPEMVKNIILNAVQVENHYAPIPWLDDNCESHYVIWNTKNNEYDALDVDLLLFKAKFEGANYSI